MPDGRGHLHQSGLSPEITDGLQVEFMTSYAGAPSVTAEPGFQVIAAANGAGHPPRVTLDLARVSQAQQSIGRGYGTSVAVLDSGDTAAATMIDFTGGNPQLIAPADDQFGHGTAVAQLIRELRPAAQIETVRVLGSTGRAESFELFQALTYAHWRGGFDVVNASLTNQLHGNCAVSLGRSIRFIVEQSRQRGKGAGTTLVAAAGNTPAARRLGYPALVPDALVATAVDWTGADAGYNVPVTPGVTTQAAYGGTRTDPFGVMTDPQGTQVSLVGTSYAAAVVTASLLA